MDIISHGLWGGIAFGRGRRFAAAFAFGILPDLVSFAPFYVYTLLNGIVFFGKPPLEIIPAWVFETYNWSHSLLVSSLLCAAVIFKNKGGATYCLAWPLHILVDIPTHSADYFPTRFLYPFSDFAVDGVSWANPLIWSLNATALAVLYGLWALRRMRARRGGSDKACLGADRRLECDG